MKSRTALTKVSAFGRQLSVLVTFLVAVPATAQPSPGATQGIQNQQNAAPPFLTQPDHRRAKALSVSQMSLGETKQPLEQFNNFVANADLTLGLLYKFKFGFNFNVNDGKSTKPVPDGYYRITVATFLKAEPQARMPDRVPLRETLEDRFVTVSPPMVTYVQNGAAEIDAIPMRFSNPTTATVINQLYVEFTPVECVAQPCVRTDKDGRLQTIASNLRDVGGYSKCLVTTPWVPYQHSAEGKCAPDQDLDLDSRRLQTEGLARFANRVMNARAQKISAESPTTISARDYAAKNHLAYIRIDDPVLYQFGQRWMHKDIRTIVRALLTDSRSQRGERACRLRPDSPKCKDFRKFSEPAFSAKPIRLPESAYQFDAAICDMIYHANLKVPMSWHHLDCGTNEGLPVYTRRNLHVGRVNVDQLLNYHQNEPFKNVLTNNFSSGRSHDESATLSVTEKLGSMLGLGATVIGIVDPTGLVLKAKSVLDIFDANRSINYSNSRNRNENDGYSMQTYVDVTPSLLDLEASQVQSCLEVKTDAYNVVLQHRNPTLGYYICGQPVRHAKIQEVYVNAYTHVSDSSTAVAFARSTQAVNLALRGDRDASLFFRMIRGALGPDPDHVDSNLAKVSWPESITQSATRYFANTVPAETNVISVPVLTRSQSTTPTFTSKLFGTYEEKFDF